MNLVFALSQTRLLFSAAMSPVADKDIPGRYILGIVLQSVKLVHTVSVLKPHEHFSPLAGPTNVP